MAARAPLSDALRQEFTTLATALRKHPHVRENRLASGRIDELVGTAPAVRIQPGEAWADAALAELAALPTARQAAWGALLTHCGAATAGKLTGKWAKEAQRLLKEAVLFGEFKEHVLRWFPLVEKPRTHFSDDVHPTRRESLQYHVSDTHADLLKGMAWFCGLDEDKELARALTALALTSYKKLPGIGPRLTKVGNACICALGMMPGMDAAGQLAVLKVKVKLGTAQKEIVKALALTALRLGIPASELDEMGVPAYGLEDVGELGVSMGAHAALLRVAGNEVHLEWRKADGKKSAAVPEAVKRDYAEDLKDLKASIKDIEKMLPAQRERLDNLFLQTGTLIRQVFWL